MIAMALQYSLDHTPILEGDVSLILVTLHRLQPRIEEVVVLVKSMVNPTLPMVSDASFDNIINIPDPTPSR
jgi:hypothetical protein